MKKSIFAITLLTAMMSMPMSMKANNMVNAQPEYEMEYDHYHHGHGHGMSEYVDDVVRTIEHTTFQSDKMNVAKRALRMRPMDAYGIRRVAECFTFNSDKKEILKFGINHCVNLYDYYKIVDVLTFSSDKEDVMRQVDNFLDSQSHHFDRY